MANNLPCLENACTGRIHSSQSQIHLSQSQLQRIVPAEVYFAVEKISCYHEKRNAGIDGSRKFCAIDSHITWKNKKVIAKNIEEAASI